MIHYGQHFYIHTYNEKKTSFFQYGALINPLTAIRANVCHGKFDFLSVLDS